MFKEKDLKSLNFGAESVQCKYLLSGRKKLVFAGIVTGDIYISLLIHCDVEALIKNIYKSETENHLSCEWTMEKFALDHSMCN